MGDLSKDRYKRSTDRSSDPDSGSVATLVGKYLSADITSFQNILYDYLKPAPKNIGTFALKAILRFVSD